MKTRYIGKKTWFCKDTQKWVSDVPRSFWLGIYDELGEMIYSDEFFKKNGWDYKFPRCMNTNLFFLNRNCYFYHWGLETKVWANLYKYRKIK